MNDNENESTDNDEKDNQSHNGDDQFSEDD